MSSKTYSDFLDFFWEHSKRISIISAFTGQVMLIYFYWRNGITITNLSNYLVASLEAYVVFVFAILVISFYFLVPALILVSGLKKKSWRLNLTIYFIYSVIWGLFSYRVANSYAVSALIIIYVIGINTIYLALAKDGMLSSRIAMPVIYFVPLVCLFIYAISPFLQNKLMTGIGILEKPYLTLVKNGSNAESEIKVLEKAYPNHKPKQIPFGGYVGYYSSSLIYEGNGMYKLSLPIKAGNISISLSVNNRNLLTIKNKIKQKAGKNNS